MDASGDSMDEVSVDVVQRPVGGAGAIDVDSASNLIVSDLLVYGAQSARKLLGGGAVDPVRVVHLRTATEYFIVPIEEDEKLVWTIFSTQFNELVSVMRSEKFTQPPNDIQVAELIRMHYSFSGSVAIDDGVFWVDCMQLRTRFEVLRVARFADKVAYVTNLGRVIDDLTTEPAQGFLAG
jgi:hypothetical protein